MTVDSPSPRRRQALLCLLAVVVAGHVFCLMTPANNIWPFSQYRMYSRPLASERVTAPYLVGVDEQGREHDVTFSFAYTRPLYAGSLQHTFSRLLASGDEDGMQAAARDCLVRYERRRQQKEHDGPALVAMRVVQREYAATLASARQPIPVAEKVLVEVLAP